MVTISRRGLAKPSASECGTRRRADALDARRSGLQTAGLLGPPDRQKRAERTERPIVGAHGAPDRRSARSARSSERTERLRSVKREFEFELGFVLFLALPPHAGSALSDALATQTGVRIRTRFAAFSLFLLHTGTVLSDALAAANASSNSNSTSCTFGLIRCVAGSPTWRCLRRANQRSNSNSISRDSWLIAGCWIGRRLRLRSGNQRSNSNSIPRSIRLFRCMLGRRSGVAFAAQTRARIRTNFELICSWRRTAVAAQNSVFVEFELAFPVVAIDIELGVARIAAFSALWQDVSLNVAAQCCKTLGDGARARHAEPFPRGTH